MKFSWTKNGKIILSGLDRFLLSSNQGSSTLTINSISSEDAGEYTCIASNDISEDRSSAQLLVEGRLSVLNRTSKLSSAPRTDPNTSGAGLHSNRQSECSQL